MTLESLNCPNCSAPLPDPGGRATVTCAHCHTVVRVTAAPKSEPIPYTPDAPMPAHVSSTLVKLLRAGRRSEAIEFYQNNSTASADEVRDVVDAIQAGLPAVAAPTGVADLEHIRQLLRDRRRTYAIQLYREQTGVTFGDAVKAIDALAAGREPPPVVLAAPDTRLSAGDMGEIRSLLERGNKIAAIKLYRERTGTGLSEAKTAVEAIERGQEPAVVAMARAVHNVPAGVDLAQIQDLLKAGQKIEAIKRYRGFTGLGLKESKDAVEAIAASTPGVPAHLGASDYRGCWNVLLIIVVGMLCVLGGCGTYAQTTGTYRCVVQSVKNAPSTRALLGNDVDAGYLVLSPGFSQSWDFDGSWQLSMNLFMPAWGSRGLGWLYLSANANDSGYTAMRSTLFKDWERNVLSTGEQVACE